MTTDVRPPQHDGGAGGAVQLTWMSVLSEGTVQVPPWYQAPPDQYAQLGAFSGHIWVVLELLTVLVPLAYEVPIIHSPWPGQ